jgi:putative FmdB family regulatory protein
MPIYEHRCNECGHVFTSFQMISSESKDPDCPECGSKSVHRLLSTFAAGSSSRPATGSGAPPCGSAGGG